MPVDEFYTISSKHEVCRRAKPRVAQPPEHDNLKRPSRYQPQAWTEAETVTQEPRKRVWSWFKSEGRRAKRAGGA